MPTVKTLQVNLYLSRVEMNLTDPETGVELKLTFTHRGLCDEMREGSMGMLRRSILDDFPRLSGFRVFANTGDDCLDLGIL